MAMRKGYLHWEFVLSECDWWVWCSKKVVKPKSVPLITETMKSTFKSSSLKAAHLNVAHVKAEIAQIECIAKLNKKECKNNFASPWMNGCPSKPTTLQKLQIKYLQRIKCSDPRANESHSATEWGLRYQRNTGLENYRSKSTPLRSSLLKKHHHICYFLKDSITCQIQFPFHKFISTYNVPYTLPIMQ